MTVNEKLLVDLRKAIENLSSTAMIYRDQRKEEFQLIMKGVFQTMQNKRCSKVILLIFSKEKKGELMFVDGETISFDSFFLQLDNSNEIVKFCLLTTYDLGNLTNEYLIKTGYQDERKSKEILPTGILRDNWNEEDSLLYYVKFSGTIFAYF